MRPEQEHVVRRLLITAPEHDLDHARRAIEALVEGNLMPLVYGYNVPRAEALRMLRDVWASERQEAAGYEVIRAYLARIGVLLGP